MTLSSTTTKISYNGDGATTSFSITFVFWDNSDIKAILRDADGVETEWTEGTQYTLSGGDGSTGTLTVETTPTDYTPASGETLVIKSDRADTQPNALPLGGQFPSTTVEQTLDQTVRMVQQQGEELGRSVKFSETSPDSDVTFPDVTGNASKVIRVNTGATGLEAADVTDLGSSAVLSDATPQAPTASGAAGTSGDVSRADHAHPLNSTYLTTLSDSALAVLTAFSGVDDTGATDSTAGVQAAVDSGAAFLLVPPGDFIVDGTVSITSPIHIFGPGGDYRLKGEGLARFRTTGDANDMFEINAHNVQMTGFAIQGTGTRDDDPSNGSGIVVGNDTTSITDAAMTSSSTTLTSASNPFTSDDVGALIRVEGAGSGGDHLFSRIATFTNSGEVELDDAASTTVSGETAEWIQHPRGLVLRDLTLFSHGKAVEFVNGANWLIDNCRLNGHRALHIENQVHPDAGDSTIRHTHFTSSKGGATTGFNIFQRSGGGLKIDTCKFLTTDEHYQINWTLGLSGGPIITNCSFEGGPDYGIRITGDKEMSGLGVWNNWFNGGGTSMVRIEDTITLSRVNICGNIFGGGSPTAIVRIGAKTSKFLVADNLFDGGSTSGLTGVQIASGATDGKVASDNEFIDCETNIQDSSGVASVTAEEVLTGTATIDFASIAAGGSDTDTITVTGAEVGDAVFLGIPSSSQDNQVIYTAYVSAADTVTVVAVNNAGGPRDPGSGTFRAVVHKF